MTSFYNFSLDDLINSITSAILIGLIVVLFKNRIVMIFKKIEESSNEKLKKILSAFITIIFSFLLILIGLKISTGIASLLPSNDPSRYGFEDPDSIKWSASSDPIRGTAMSNVAHTTTKKIKGKRSMKVHVKMNGSQTGRKDGMHQGEVSVDPTFFPPRGYPEFKETQSLDLSGKTIAASVIITTRKLVGKDPDKATYLQMFIEDCSQLSSRYESTPKKITSSGQPRLEFKVDTYGKAVCRIGIKIGLNDEDYSNYEDDIYIDAVHWK